MNYLIVDNLQIYAYHGAIPTENKVGGEYSISLKIGYDFSQAARMDSLKDAINYAEICELIRKEMKQPSQLIENVAWRIQQTILSKYPQIETMETTVRKMHPPVPFPLSFLHSPTLTSIHDYWKNHSLD